MKNKYKIRRSFLLFLLGVSNAVGAVTLPSQSYTVYSPLYEMNHDNVKMDQGTIFKGINHVLKAGNNEWGDLCVEQSVGDKMGCRRCCGHLLEEQRPDERADYDDLYQNCLSMCNTGLPLGGAPLDIPLWFILPLCGLYGVIQCVRYNKLEN